MIAAPDIPVESPAEPTDAELVRRAKAGDFLAMEALTTRYEKQVFSLALRMLRHHQDAEDLTQHTFISAVQHLGEFRGEAAFSTWLLRIATHAALKVIRKRRNLETVSFDAGGEPGPDGEAIPHPEFIADWRESPRELVARRETRQLLDDALNQLEEKHRLVFLLRDVEGFSVRETAEQLGITEVNVKVRLLRARLALRELLTREFGDPAKRIERGAHHHE